MVDRPLSRGIQLFQSKGMLEREAHSICVIKIYVPTDSVSICVSVCVCVRARLCVCVSVCNVNGRSIHTHIVTYLSNCIQLHGICHNLHDNDKSNVTFQPISG